MAPGDEKHTPVTELKALDKLNMNWTRQPDHKFFIGFDFYPVNNWHFHDPEHYPLFGGNNFTFTYFHFLKVLGNEGKLFLQVQKNHQALSSQLNHISLRLPSSPLLSQHDAIPPQTFCNESTVSNCTKEFCECTYTLQVPLGSLVELILIDEGKCISNYKGIK